MGGPPQRPRPYVVPTGRTESEPLPVDLVTEMARVTIDCEEG
jgi:hypothetical protein